MSAATEALNAANSGVNAAKLAQSEAVLNAIKPGSSFQSIHARAMATAGFAAADQHCYDFFLTKGDFQTGGGVVADTLTKFGNMAAGAAGAAGAGAGLPSGFALGSSIY